MCVTWEMRWKQETENDWGQRWEKRRRGGAGRSGRRRAGGGAGRGEVMMSLSSFSAHFLRVTEQAEAVKNKSSFHSSLRPASALQLHLSSAVDVLPSSPGQRFLPWGPSCPFYSRLLLRRGYWDKVEEQNSHLRVFITWCWPFCTQDLLHHDASLDSTQHK